MSYLDIALSLFAGVLGGLTGASMLYVFAKRTLESDILMEKVDEFLSEVQTNKDLQTKLYTVGAIIGQGIKSGVGLQQKTGKFNMNDIIGLAISQFLPGLLGGGQQNQPQEATTSVNNKIGLT